MANKSTKKRNRKREDEIVKLVLIAGKSQSDVARRLGISHQRVNQIIHRWLREQPNKIQYKGTVGRPRNG